MAAGEREWDDRPAAVPSQPEAPASGNTGLECGLWALIMLSIPVAGLVLWFGAMALVALFGGS